MSMDKEVKKQLLDHLIAAMDDRSKGKLKKSDAPAPKETKAEAEPAPKKCPDCGKMTCACDDEGGDTASEEVAMPVGKSVKDRLKALIAAKADKE